MYEWDAGKAAANLAKHGVSFASAAAFDWNTALVRPDEKHSGAEARFRAIGPIGGRLHTMVLRIRGEKIRIISLRRSHRKEELAYAEKSKET